jgi:hypothetical protein
MSILNNFTVVDGRERRPLRVETPAVFDTRVEIISSGATQDKYMLRAELGTEFWANRAQYEDALKIAQRVMLQRIHGPVLNLIHELRFNVCNGKEFEALTVLDRMEDELLGEFK